MTERALRIVNENMPEIIGFDDFRHEAVKALLEKAVLRQVHCLYFESSSIISLLLSIKAVMRSALNGPWESAARS